jgi:hypothetical protein
VHVSPGLRCGSGVLAGRLQKSSQYCLKVCGTADHDRNCNAYQQQCPVFNQGQGQGDSGQMHPVGLSAKRLACRELSRNWLHRSHALYLINPCYTSGCSNETMLHL